MCRLRLALLLLPLVLLAGCGSTRETVFQDQYLAFGTLIEVTFYGVDQAHAATVSAEIEQQFMGWHHDWHAWEPGPLTELNARLATPQPFTPEPAMPGA